MSISAADLKAQGNALFGQKNFAEAEKKYTAAIREANDDAADSKGLAVLCANRAACRLSLKRYMDASSDATKATQLDPAYPKAFARLATAQDHLGKYTASTQNWKQALDVLPANLTTAEQVQKVQYEAGLKIATAALVKLGNTVIGDKPGPMGSGGPFIVKGEGRMPWDIAAQLVPRLRVQQPVDLYSSAWVIHGAYDDFMNGVRLMGQIQKDNRTGAMSGTRGGLVELSNGVLRDIRVMHLPSGDFIGKYNTLVSFDIQSSRGWGEHGPDVVIREALSRQRSEGWDATRPAVSFTVRAWIMQGVLNTSMRHMPAVAAEFYKNSLHVIRTLKEHWINESKKDRGTIFEKTFIFGIRQLYLQAIMQCYKGSDSSDEPLEQLLEESKSLIHDVDAALCQPRSQEPVDPGFVSSFYIYPRGHAFAMKGFYYNKMSTRNGNDRKAFFRKAALEYMEAAKCFPEDDEQHPWFLHVAYTNMMTAGSFSLRETLDIMERIKVTIPKAKVIWERSSLGAGGMWDIVAGVHGQEQLLRSMLAQGQLTLDSRIATKAVEHL